MNQIHEAAEASAALRAERKRMKGCLRRGEVTLSDAWSEPSFATMRLSDLLESLPRMSAHRASRVLVSTAVGYARPVGKLRQIERDKLEYVIRNRHEDVWEMLP